MPFRIPMLYAVPLICDNEILLTKDVITRSAKKAIHIKYNKNGFKERKEGKTTAGRCTFQRHLHKTLRQIRSRSKTREKILVLFHKKPRIRGSIPR